MPIRTISTRVNVFGHPIHPLLVHFPVAALMGVMASDVAYWFTEDVFWARGSFWLLVVGTLGGWVAGTVGLVDLTTVARIRRLITAWCHALFAVMTLSLSSLNLLLRFGDPAAQIFPWGIYLSFLTGGLIALTGYLGGRLVYEYAVGVDVEEAFGRQVKP